MNIEELENLSYRPGEVKMGELGTAARKMKFVNDKAQKYLTELYYRTCPRHARSRPIIKGYNINFNRITPEDLGIPRWARVTWKANKTIRKDGAWWIVTDDWRTEAEKKEYEADESQRLQLINREVEEKIEVKPETIVAITAQHAFSLAALVEHWKKMINCLGKENCELTTEYCDELLRDLKK